jgi:hypothetical protein
MRTTNSKFQVESVPYIQLFEQSYYQTLECMLRVFITRPVFTRIPSRTFAPLAVLVYSDKVFALVLFLKVLGSHVVHVSRPLGVESTKT